MLMRFQAFLDRGVGLGSAALSRQIIGYSIPLEIGQRGFAQSLVNATKPDRVVGSDKVRGQQNGGGEAQLLLSRPGNVRVTLGPVVDSDGRFPGSIVFRGWRRHVRVG